MIVKIQAQDRLKKRRAYFLRSSVSCFSPTTSCARRAFSRRSFSSAVSAEGFGFTSPGEEIFERSGCVGMLDSAGGIHLAANHCLMRSFGITAAPLSLAVFHGDPGA